MENIKEKKERTNRTTRQVGNGEGTLYYSEVLGKWIYQYFEKNTGKRKSISQDMRHNETKKEFKARVTELKNNLNKGTHIEKNNITVYQLGLEIIENKFKRHLIQENSYHRTLGNLEHIKNSSLCNIKIQDATPKQLQDFIDGKEIYANSTIDKFWGLLTLIFKEAVKRDYIIKNPMLKIEKIKSLKENKRIEAFTIDEQKAFLNALTQKEKYRNIFIIALYSGLRMGEILALKPDDINFKEKTIHVQRTLTKDRTGKTILGDTTKTYCSDRIIPITPLFENELRHAIQNRHLNIYNLIFIQPNGKLLTVSNMNSRFNRLCCNANLSVHPYIIKRKDKKTGKLKEIHSKRSSYNQHMLRHTYATRMIEAGVPAEVLQQLMGHKDITTTINTYTSIFNKYKNKQVDKYVNYIQKIK